MPSRVKNSMPLKKQLLVCCWAPVGMEGVAKGQQIDMCLDPAHHKLCSDSLTQANVWVGPETIHRKMEVVHPELST